METASHANSTAAANTYSNHFRPMKAFSFHAPARWITPFCSMAFGCHAFAALYFAETRFSAFATILKPGDFGSTIGFVVGPLLVGALLQLVGLYTRRPVGFSVGALLGLIVFGMAEYSSFRINRWGTGVPAYFIISTLYFSEYIRSIMHSKIIGRQVVVLALERAQTSVCKTP